MEKCEKFNKTFCKKIKKSIKYSGAVGNRIYNMENIHILRKLFALFFYCCIFICENGCRQSAANSLVSHKQRKHVLDIFLYFVVLCYSEPGTVKHIAW